MELLKGVPGFNDCCKGCTNQLKDSYPYADPPCAAAQLAIKNNCVFPAINNEGCINRQPNLITFLKDIRRRTTPILRALQSSLSQL